MNHGQFHNHLPRLGRSPLLAGMDRGASAMATEIRFLATVWAGCAGDGLFGCSRARAANAICVFRHAVCCCTATLVPGDRMPSLPSPEVNRLREALRLTRRHTSHHVYLRGLIARAPVDTSTDISLSCPRLDSAPAARDILNCTLTFAQSSLLKKGADSFNIHRSPAMST